jgi:hypothetical protein
MWHTTPKSGTSRFAGAETLIEALISTSSPPLSSITNKALWEVHLQVSIADHHLDHHFDHHVHLFLDRDHQDVVQISKIQDPQHQ